MRASEQDEDRLSSQFLLSHFSFSFLPPCYITTPHSTSSLAQIDIATGLQVFLILEVFQCQKKTLFTQFVTATGLGQKAGPRFCELK